MYDVIIVGCGVAGGYLASLLKGLNVLVLEKDKKVTLKDSGIVSSRFREFFPSKLIKSNVKEMRAVSPSGIKFSLRSDKPFAYILKRAEFSLYLRRLARKTATVKYEAVIKIVYRDDCVSVITESGEYMARLVVGCDGTFSIVRRTLGIKLPGMHPGIFVRAQKLHAQTIEVYFNKYFSPEFFSWVIPQVNEYGIITSIRPKENLEYFKRKMSLPEGRIYSSFIPLGYCKSFANRTLLIGDACGQVKPLTGGGIMFSIYAAKHAADVIKSAIQKNNFSASFLSSYERRWKKDLAWEIKLQLIARKVYKRLTHRDIDNMFVDFGHSISNVREFDYDRLSEMWKKLPKLRLARFVIAKLPALF